MSFLYPSAFPIAAQTARRTATLPIPIIPRSSSPPPVSAPPAPSSSSRSRPTRAESKLVSSVQSSFSNARDLQSEIERLSAACDEHERKIRASRNSIEHRLFIELPHTLTRLNEIDDNAENMTAELHATINAISPILDEKLSSIIKARQEDVETMRARTTPWKTFFEDKEGEGQAGRGKIQRVDGMGLNDTDGLGKIERWAEEVEIFLTTDIVRLRQELSLKSVRSRRHRILGIILVVAFAVWMGWLKW